VPIEDATYLGFFEDTIVKKTIVLLGIPAALFSGWYLVPWVVYRTGLTDWRMPLYLTVWFWIVTISVYGIVLDHRETIDDWDSS